MQPPSLSVAARRVSWRVFFLVLLSAAYFYQGGEHNEATRFDQIRAIHEHGELWIDRFAANTADVVRAGGHTFPDKPPGTTILGLAPWRLAREVLDLVPLVDGARLTLTAWFVTIVLAALPTAMTALLLLRFLARNGWTLGSASIAAVGYGLGTIAFPFATMFFGHQVAACFAFASFYLIWSCRFLDPRARRWRLTAAGLMLGFLPLIENPGAIASGLLGLYALQVAGWRASLPLVLGGVVGFAPLPIYNALAFGDPTILSYSFHAKEGSAFPGQRQGFMGVSLPRFDALRFITISREKGLFYANPWLALGLLGPFLVGRARGVAREIALAFAIVAGFLVFNAGFGNSHVYWGGGYSFGPRYILICVPFLAILAAVTLRVRYLNVITTSAVAATILMMLPPTAVEPRTPYLQEPLFTSSFPLYARGLYSASPSAPFGKVAVFESYGAFNFGRAIRLARDFEMVPLTLLWAVAAVGLVKSRGRAQTLAKGMFGVAAVALGLWPALHRLSASSTRTEGLCRIVSAGPAWPNFADPAVPPRPDLSGARQVVKSPVVGPVGSIAVDGSVVSVTFTGEFVPRRFGWHSVALESAGRAALYIDGRRWLEVEGEGEAGKSGQTSDTRVVYLSSERHEILIRSVLGPHERDLRVAVKPEGSTSLPLEQALALSTTQCGIVRSGSPAQGALRP